MRRGKSATTFLIGILLVAATLLCYQTFRKRHNQELRLAICKHLTELFPNSRIYVGVVTSAGSGSIVVTDVGMSQKQSASKEPVLSAQRIVLSGKFAITDWLQGSISLSQVELFGVQVDIWPEADENWSVQCLVPHPKSEARPPKIVFRDAIVRLRKNSELNAPVLAFHNLSGTIQPAAPGEFSPGEKVFKAQFAGVSSGTAEHLQLSASVAPETGNWTLQGNIDKFLFSRSLLARLPAQLSSYLTQLAGLECEASAGFEVVSNRDGPTAFRLRGQLTHGRLQDARLPYPLENLSSEFSCENTQFQLRNMHAESGMTKLELNTDILGLGLNSPMTIVAHVRNLDLDQRLRQSLPGALQEHWDKLQLSGRVSGNIKLWFDGQKWTPALSVDCEDVAIRPWLFPYLITNIRGPITYQDATVSSPRIQGRAGGQDVFGRFAFTRGQSSPRESTNWLGYLECQAAGPVSIDEQLLTALTPKGQSTAGAETFIRSLRPSGSVQLTKGVFIRNSEAAPWQKSIDANVYSGSINYRQFEYPIYDIRGHIVCENESWQLDQFEGRNDSGRILCSGVWETNGAEGVPFDLYFEALDVPIEEELKLALPSETQFVWDELQPLGAIDRVSVRLQRPHGQDAVNTTVHVLEESRSNVASGRSLRLRPKAFPYWLTDIDCDIRYTPGYVVMEKVSGMNGASRLTMQGTCEPQSDGRWKAKVDWLPQTRLMVESELLKALPKSIRESLVKIDFRGPISIMGKSEVTFNDRAADGIETSWDCQMALEDGQLGDGRHIGSLRGTMWMQGHSNGSQINATGSITMDALTVMGVPVTRLNGPFALLGDKLFFGEQVYEALPQWRIEDRTRMTAKALSGELMLAGFGKLDEGEFHINASLQSANLNLLLRDLGVDNADAQATCDAELDFSGVPWNSQTYDGHGSIHLSEAQLYQLPFMIRLMNVASVTAKNDSAFQTADINFELDGDRIPLQVACDGEVIRLRGDGEMNLRREIELDLYSYVGRGLPINEVVNSLVKESRYATFMLIEVDGTLDNPRMLRQPFPQIEATFQQIFPELAGKPEREPFLPWHK